MDYDPFEELLEQPMLLKTPVVRNGNNVTIGHKPEVWKTWIKLID